MANIILDQSVVPGVSLDQQKVYLRPSWTSVWVETPYLYCDWATWSTSGMQTNRAQLTWRYGFGMRPGEADFGIVSRLMSASSSRIFVRIDFGDPLNVWRWVGTVETIGDVMQGGSNPNVPAGEQKIVCYGMEYLLEEYKILTSQIQKDSQLSEGTTDRGITFNANGRGNRSTTLYGPVGQKHFIFGYDNDLFSGESNPWSTREIIKYLLATQTPPHSTTPSSSVPWTIDAASEDVLPDYDAPEVVQHNRRTIDLLDNLITRERSMTWWSEYNLSSNAMEIKVASFTDTPIDVGDGKQIPANPNVDTISIENDPAAQDVQHAINSLDMVDQVVVQGARRTSTFSINNIDDGTAVPGWTAAEESRYNSGASNSADYPPAGRILLQRKANAAARSSDELAKVYSEITLPEDWNRFAGDGHGNETNPVFPDEDNPGAAVELYSKEAYFSANLSLLKDRDYSSNRINQGTFRSHDLKPQEPRKPFALAPNPQQRQDEPSDKTQWKYLYSDRLGRISEFANLSNPGTNRFIQEEYSCRVRILPESTRVLLEVVGVDHQHVIARNQFFGVPPADNFEGQPEWDWREWIMTVTIVEDRFAESRYPTTIPSVNAVRNLVIDAGESYRRDYVVPYTVVDVDDNNNLVRSTSGGYVVDDKPKMDKVARLAYQWYSKPRNSFSFNTVFRSPADNFALGRYVKTVNTGNNQLPVDSIVTELKISHSEVSESEVPQNARVSLKTSFAEIDPQSFLATFG